MTGWVISKKKRTIVVIEFRYFTEVEGRFAHLLPKKDGDEPAVNFALRDAIGICETTNGISEGAGLRGFIARAVTVRTEEEFDVIAAGIAEATLSA